jgi:hypothetical protein
MIVASPPGLICSGEWSDEEICAGVSELLAGEGIRFIPSNVENMLLENSSWLFLEGSEYP